MKIAVVAPRPVPASRGGAENLYAGLVASLRAFTSHQVELVTLPFPERNLRDVLDGYRRFAELDLSDYDLVISTKYPSWMVRHPNHICWMLHRLRGLYDTYHFFCQPGDGAEKPREIAALSDFMDRNLLRREALPELFSRLETILCSSDIDSRWFAHPGAFGRTVVHFLDGIGLAPTAIRKYAAISSNVAGRNDYFPLGSHVEVIYPPSHLSGLRTGRDDYLFTASRLDGPKRIDLLIQAMRYVGADVPLRIAGTGPENDRLRTLAANDHRISFLGFVDDDKMVELYADSLAVLFAPYDEDYGLVTIEAMLSGKPVLTTLDSGGPNEFVADGVTGFSVIPRPEALAECIEELWRNRPAARRMGESARGRVQGITWRSAIQRLLSPAKRTGRRLAFKRLSIGGLDRPKLTVASTFSVYPAKSGGQLRVFQLYRRLAEAFDVELITFCEAGKGPLIRDIAPGVREFTVRKSREHERAEQAYHAQIGQPVTDVVMTKLWRLTPEYVVALAASTKTADAVVASHPYLLPAILHVCDKPLWYEAHNVEAELKKHILPKNAAGQELFEAVRQVEAECCRRAETIMVCSDEDARLLAARYGVERSRIVTVPNGVDVAEVPFVTGTARRELRRRLGCDNTVFAVFVGSWHGPNIDAVRRIGHMALQLCDVTFLIVGGVGRAMRDEKLPANVAMLGEVDDEAKEVALSLADVALNPVTSGSGTNLKMLEYFAAGIPVISTRLGARGLNVEDNRHLTLAEDGEFTAAIARAAREPLEVREIRLQNARRHVEDSFDWSVIAREFLKSPPCRRLCEQAAQRSRMRGQMTDCHFENWDRQPTTSALLSLKSPATTACEALE